MPIFQALLPSSEMSTVSGRSSRGKSSSNASKALRQVPKKSQLSTTPKSFQRRFLRVLAKRGTHVFFPARDGQLGGEVECLMAEGAAGAQLPLKVYAYIVHVGICAINPCYSI